MDEEQTSPPASEPTAEPAAPAPETDPNAPPPSPPRSFEEMEPEEAIAFDFFGDNEPTQESQEETPPPAPAPPKEAAPEIPPPAPAPPAGPTFEEIRSEMAALRAQNELLAKQVAQQTQAKSEPTPAARQQAEAQERVFDIDVPDELVNALSNEDPLIRKNALKVMVSATADIAYKKMRTDLEGMIQPRVAQTIQESQQQQAQASAVYNDFYGRYPQFNRPEYRMLVRSVADAVAAESGIQTWTPVLRDAIAARLVQLGIGAQPAGAARAAPREVPRVPKVVGSGVRPSPPASGNSFADGFEDLVGPL